jgi:thiol-disulfide isomerase/thioredoxin
MKKLLAVAALVGLVAATGGADDREPARDKKEAAKPERPPVSLKGGDPAPPVKASQWLQGEEVRAFEPGKVYVIEFWATWCGPCIDFMPHLAEQQARYKSEGVTVIGFTAKGDHGNNQESVAAFVKKNGPKFKYTFAYADDRATWDAWMTAAGRDGIPCTFVVDKAGRIAYVGHPMYLGMVLPKVIAGTATARAVSDEMAWIEADFRAAVKEFSHDPKAGLRALKEFEAKYQPLADFYPSARSKLSYLPKYGKAGEAKEYAESLVAKAVTRGDRLTLSLVSAVLRLGDGKESKELLAVAVKAAEADVRLSGGTDAQALIDLARTYAVAGDKAKAKEYAGKAVQAAAGESAALKEFIEREARTLRDEAPGDKM